MYSKEIIFYIPGFFTKLEICDKLAYCYREKPNYFYDNAKIGAFYDCPGSIWNGGRLFNKIVPIASNEDLVYMRQVFEDWDIPIRLTFTNGLIKQEHLIDLYANKVAYVFNNGKNEILCNSELLENYLRGVYKDNYKYISSITKCLRTDILKQLQEIEQSKYFLTVLDFDWNNKFDILSQIKSKDKCEILLNPSCVPHCKWRENHYNYIGEMELYGKSDIEYHCGSNARRYYEVQKFPHYISPKDIEEKYLPMGFNKFKIEGRHMADLEFIEVLVDYLIKDEYKAEVRSNLQTVYHPLQREGGE